MFVRNRKILSVSNFYALKAKKKERKKSLKTLLGCGKMQRHKAESRRLTFFSLF